VIKQPPDHFSRLASQYATCRPHYPHELFKFLSELAPGRGLACDCAAGSGQATLPLAQWFSRVLGTDISGAMLEHAPAHPNVEYRVSPAEDTGLPARSADLVTVAQALHWLDLEGFYAEVHRVLAPGGVLAVWSYATQRLDDGELDVMLTRFYTEVVGPFWPDERRHVEAGYRTLPFPYVEVPAPEFAMAEQWTLAQLLGYVGTWSATQRFREAEGYDPLPQLGQELARTWGDPALSRRVRWPLSVKAGHKQD
jgi:ubiquinone/menaquinone biosynthesis C-methylase UbiE